MTEADAFFHQRADGVFVGNDPARGAWSVDHCHAGPVAGLVARAAEVEVGAEKQLTRLTMDVLRPVPLAGIRVAAETTRHTRTLATTRVTVHDLDDALLVQATTMHLAERDIGPVPTPQIATPRIEEAEAGPFAIGAGRHDLPNFAHLLETKYPPGHEFGPGPKMIWLRTPDLVAGEPTSPVQGICALADCGNGISWNLPATKMGFMNTDLTLQIHRAPEPGWHAADAISHWHGNGIGMSQAVLFDAKGPVGTALQTLTLFPAS
ncbi:thioesterase family protein [Tritonibacter scottomollicae]|uniref:Thioesterase superfamily protein n=1 Tax=Tritonibacter scottomollicae TaxID=483013 RepID=A0A2T1ANY8_TRISK|nr:thioesterase family protein [Tritonibacter scottomollicae]PRZ50282.1 thioesterase superfamily protein [Tritonibacter scottomollicae]